MSPQLSDAGFTLLHTNDLHSHMEQAARIAGYVRQVRAETSPDQLLVVDIGDFIDRARPETEGTDGEANRDLMEAIRYDAVVPGNNEGLTYSADRLAALYRAPSAPVVCANLLQADTGRRPPWLVPSLMTERGGLRVGLLGLTAAFADYYRLLNWDVRDPIETAHREIEQLRPQVDVLIVLSHLGVRFDELLASDVEGIDLILGAHTHHLFERPIVIGRTTIGAAGKFGSHIGHLRIGRDAATGRLSIHGSAVTVDERIDPDPAAVKRLAVRRKEADVRMSRVIAGLREPLSVSLETESPLPTLLAAALRRKTGAEVGLVNAGQLLGNLPAGPVTEGDIHAICPSPINPCRMKLSGETLLEALEQSLTIDYQHLKIKGFGFRGQFLGTLCMDGMEATADLSLPAGSRITSATIGGEPLDPRREYVVGTLDMFTFGVGYVGLKEGKDIEYFLPEFLRDELAAALTDPALLADCRRHRWRLSGADRP